MQQAASVGLFKTSSSKWYSQWQWTQDTAQDRDYVHACHAL